MTHSAFLNKYLPKNIIFKLWARAAYVIHDEPPELTSCSLSFLKYALTSAYTCLPVNLIFKIMIKYVRPAITSKATVINYIMIVLWLMKLIFDLQDAGNIGILVEYALLSSLQLWFSITCNVLYCSSLRTCFIFSSMAGFRCLSTAFIWSTQTSVCSDCVLIYVLIAYIEVLFLSIRLTCLHLALP